eukprot:XP_011662235.1 PREDICTED: heparanase [Strongylocentrotus purpuratus]
MTSSVTMGVGVVTTSLMVLVVMMLIVCKEDTMVREPGTRRDFFAADQYRFPGSRQRGEERTSFVKLTVNTSTVLRTVDDRFVSVGATMGSFNRTLGQLFNSTRFWTVARGLSPALYRMGGAEADFTYFDALSTRDECAVNRDFNGKGKLKDYGKLKFFNQTLCAHTWDNINEFARSVGWEILYCLNALTRNETSWDPTNALELINYTRQRGYPVLWGLGNEPNGFPRKANVTVTGTQMADAFHTLRKAVTQLPDHSDIILVGPDTSAPIKKIKKKKGNMLTGTENYLNEQVTLFSSSQNHIEGSYKKVGNATNNTSFHFYVHQR